jgi:2-methylisocitrate lyase-like PEP mutase family enzyme
VNQSAKLRELLSKQQSVVSIGVYDCFSAMIAEHAGHAVVSISGNTLTASLLGLPDIGLITMTEVATQAQNIADAVGIPVLVDGDTGYGNAFNAMRAVRHFEAAGLAGMSIEDQIYPKRSSSIGNANVIPVKEMASKLAAACEARKSDDFIIIGRTDAMSSEGIDGAIERALRYCDAGADVIFVNSLNSEEDMRKATRAIPRPMKINVSEGAPPSRFTADELKNIGFKIIGYSGFMQRAAGKAMLNALGIFEKEGSTELSMKEMLMSKAERYEVLNLKKYSDLEKKISIRGA